METADQGRGQGSPAALVDDVPTPLPARHRRRWPRVLGILTLVLALIASAAVAGVWYLAKNLEGNVTTIEGFDLAEPVASYEPVNILVMGSDNRGGGNSSAEQALEIPGERSDTTLLVHLSAGRDRALVVSIPRDTLVTMPACASESGQWEVTGKFNTAFTFGGAPCTVETVERMTGIDIHHAVVVDFLGFKGIVDALGGVDVCLEEAVFDQDSGLDLPAGWSTVTGDQALAFVRARKSLGDGSDIDRIARQHQFLSSAIREATDRGLILRPVTLYRMLDAATRSLSVDAGIDQVTEMAAMAESLRDLQPENIKFVTMPFQYSSDGVDVLVNKAVAQEIWTAIAKDEEWPKPSAAGTEVLTVLPNDILVQVSNGNGLENAATDAARDIAVQGFVINSLAVADSSSYTDSVIAYHPDDADKAQTLAASVPDSILRPDPAAPRGQIELIVGANYRGAVAVTVPRVPEGTWADPKPTTADQSICAR